jgi:hypothetical protein
MKILLKCSGTRKWREQRLRMKWLSVTEEAAHMRKINYPNAVELRNIGKYPYTIRCKWKNKMSNIQGVTEQGTQL